MITVISNGIPRSLKTNSWRTIATRNNLKEAPNILEIKNLSKIHLDKNNQKKVESILKKNSVHFDLLGETTDKEIIINDEPTFTVDKVTEFYKGWLYKYMS